MRNSAQCPKCEGKKIFVCENRQPSQESSNTVVPFAVVSALIPRDEMGTKSGSKHRTDVGIFETWICAGCGYTEWYAKDPEQLLEKLALRRDSGVRLVTAPARP